MSADTALRTAAWATWLALLAAWVLAAPPQPDDVGAWVVRILTGDWAGEEPLLVAEFQLMGIWPLAFTALLARDLRDRPLPAWPFLLASVAIGAFGLLPWLGLRRWDAPRRREAGRVEAAAASPILGLIVAALSIGWIGWGLVHGDPEAFLARRATDGFVWVMTWDFCALWAWSVVLAVREATGHGAPLRGALAVLPGVGAGLWAALRPRPA